MTTPFRLRLDARATGTLCCALAVGFLTQPTLLSAAIAVELVAAAFWCWARAAPDAATQVPRWSWLRRPATALWVALAAHLVAPTGLHTTLPASGALRALQWIEAVGVVWAGLELLAALPLARPFSDLSGPFLGIRPWLPVLLPAVGFIVLWRQAQHWITVTPVRNTAVVLLLVTAILGTLRAFSRRPWTASLRWLAVTDSALAAMLVALRVVPAQSSYLLWLAACGGHAFLLAGELRGAMPRRGSWSTGLWRAASWTSLAALSWPTLVAAGYEGRGLGGPVLYLATAAPVALAAWITVGRMVTAVERRKLARPGAALTTSMLAALVVLAIGPTALILAWWAGFEPMARAGLMAALPAAFGGVTALLVRRRIIAPLSEFGTLLGRVMPAVAGGAYRTVIAIERRLVAFLAALLRGVTAPLVDLHTGDAQEYLLFLVGISVLALVLPLLQ